MKSLDQPTLFPLSAYIAPDAPFEKRLAAWQATNKRLGDIARRINASKRERAARIWLAAFGYKMPNDLCVHNASVALGGWATTREQLRAARQCSKLLNDWSANRAASAASIRIYDRLNLRHRQAQAGVPWQS